MDAIGLGAFTAIGIDTALNVGYNSIFLLIFVGVITGIGGGMIRDIMAGMMPFVFVKHVYACASIAGAVLCLVLRLFLGDTLAMILSAAVVVLIRTAGSSLPLESSTGSIGWPYILYGRRQ